MADYSWAQDAAGNWVYGADAQPAGADLAAFDPANPVDHTLAAAGPPNVDDVVVDELQACPTCGTGVHPDRIRG